MFQFHLTRHPSCKDTHIKMASVPDFPIKRVFLWGVPRCLSTAFMRAFSNIEDFVVWYEPYLMVQRAGDVRAANANSSTIAPPHAHPDTRIYHAPDHFYSIFEESNTYAWVREQLEGNFPGKRLVFVKEMVEGISGHYTDLPKGYRHTFLIRHPLKVFASLKTVLSHFPEVQDIDLDKLPQAVIPSGYYFKEMYEFTEYVKNVDSKHKPLIIDADALQANPVAVMKAYCQEIGIPFDERIVTWDGDASFDNWMGPKELFVMLKIQGLHKKSVSESAGFCKLTELPLRSDLPDDVLKLADASMEWYEKLHAQRLIV